ncbi:hypothetical protein [Bacillus sp. AFS031507]|uniref:hypothetical protein n=1 Tax=Bacillus sp. AFS031507 TaxID=2033496 RepID=UPI000BFE0D05|nr:hypothetical protein [Bacillus sp. AFS031507]PGY09123.1 hypothetical protein COE25_18830 [Bacillus sp. AFS031507]
MERLYKIFTNNHFELKKETTKAVEFEKNESKEKVYLLPTKEISIVLSPETVEGDISLIDKSKKLYHNTSLNQFPKRKNKGKNPIHYGYSFKFQSEDELDTFLKNFN